MITLTTSLKTDYWLLTLACALKGMVITKHTEQAGTPSALSWAGGTVVGPAAVLLFLEASVPNPSLFPNGNVGMPLALLHWRAHTANIDANNNSALQANAHLVTRQLMDGRPFLQGDSAGLADLVGASWILAKEEALSGDAILDSWMQRMKALPGSRRGGPPTSLLTQAALSGMPDYAGILVGETTADGERFYSPLDP